MRTPLRMSSILLRTPSGSCYCSAMAGQKKKNLIVFDREYFAQQGRKGGRLAAKQMTPEERRESARKAAQARWAKKKVKP